jgi:hypothetical protein
VWSVAGRIFCSAGPSIRNSTSSFLSTAGKGSSRLFLLLDDVDGDDDDDDVG